MSSEAMSPTTVNMQQNTKNKLQGFPQERCGKIGERIAYNKNKGRRPSKVFQKQPSPLLDERHTPPNSDTSTTTTAEQKASFLDHLTRFWEPKRPTPTRFVYSISLRKKVLLCKRAVACISNVDVREPQLALLGILSWGLSYSTLFLGSTRKIYEAHGSPPASYV